MRSRRVGDLFELFPDLPRPRRYSHDGFLARLHHHIQVARARARVATRPTTRPLVSAAASTVRGRPRWAVAGTKV